MVLIARPFSTSLLPRSATRSFRSFAPKLRCVCRGLSSPVSSNSLTASGAPSLDALIVSSPSHQYEPRCKLRNNDLDSTQPHFGRCTCRSHPEDTHTHSKVAEYKPVHLHLDWNIDWDARIIHGRVSHTIELIQPGLTSITLDASYLKIKTVHVRRQGCRLQSRHSNEVPRCASPDPHPFVDPQEGRQGSRRH